MSLPIDGFELDPNRILQALARRVAALEAQAGQGQALTIGQASGPFFLPNSSPGTPSGGCTVYAVGGELRVIQSNGSVRMIPAPAAPIENQVSFTSSDIGATPTAGQYNALRADAVATRAYGFALTTILRNAGYIAT
jgi:hypothetical protein